jgi:hypothetical protein
VAKPLDNHHEACINQQKQQALDSLTLRLAGGSSSSNSTGAASDDGCFNASCTLCQLEKRQQQEQQRASAGSSSNSSSAAARVDVGDPFMWRRLMWGLFGRVKPSAQRLYAAEQGMCPHSDSTR